MKTNTLQINKDIKFTYSDYLLLPDNGKHYQLIDGEFIMTPAPFTYHQEVSGNIENILRNYVSDYNLGKVYYAPTDVVLSDKDVVQPDILFISKERTHIINKKNIKGAPDLIVEILSPKTKKIDLILKQKLYAKYGVSEYWIVDPDKKQIKVLVLDVNSYKKLGIYHLGQTFKSKIISGLKIKVQDVFGKQDKTGN